MPVILFDDSSRERLFPLTFLRPIAEIRIGILSISEKWKRHLGTSVSYLTANYLQKKFPIQVSPISLYINGSVCPDIDLLEAIDKLHEGQALVYDQLLIAAKSTENFSPANLQKHQLIAYQRPFVQIKSPEDIFKFNECQIVQDFSLLTKGRTSAKISSTNTVLGEHIFVEEGVEAECASFNTRQGPIYLGMNSSIWEGCHIRGPVAMCHGSIAKMGTKIYGATTIGPHSRIGGEVNNTVIMGNSSKVHEGYLGNAVIGEWCNLGAGTNNSNLKNNYSDVKLWDYSLGSFRNTGLQFCGLIMGDYARSGINTMFNTGSVVGLGANVFGAGFMPKYIADFSWGGFGSYVYYELPKFLEMVSKALSRREKNLLTEDKELLIKIYNLTTRQSKVG